MAGRDNWSWESSSYKGVLHAGMMSSKSTYHSIETSKSTPSSSSSAATSSDVNALAAELEDLTGVDATSLSKDEIAKIRSKFDKRAKAVQFMADAFDKASQVRRKGEEIAAFEFPVKNQEKLLKITLNLT